MAKKSPAKHQADTASKSADASVTDDGMLDVEEAASLLNVSRPTFYRMLRRGEIKGSKVGRQWRFQREDIERLIHGQPPRIDLPGSLQPLIEELGGQIEKVTGSQPQLPADESSPAQAVYAMIQLADRMNASSLHLEPLITDLNDAPVAAVRMRIDGVLHLITTFPLKLLPAMIEQWKSMAGCNLHIKDLPQDGRAYFKLGDGSQLTLRTAFMPAQRGETVAVRLLRPDAVILSLDQIPFTPQQRKTIDRHLAARSGTILLTGPVGSGKTTTLYACLNTIAGPSRKVMTVEDPIEFALPWLAQVRVTPELTVAKALRAATRADADAIMLTKIQDRDTALGMLAASQLGHLMFAALHTLDAPSAIQRLLDLGIDPYLISENLRLVVGQRLLRRLNPDCAREATPSEQDLVQARAMVEAGGLTWDALPHNWREPRPELADAPQAYRGRTMVAELLEMTPALAQALRQNADVDRLREIAVTDGMITFKAHAVRLAAEGQIALSEALRLDVQH